MGTPNTCQKCGAPLTGDAREGFCLKCLFQQAIAGTVRVSPPDEEEVGTVIGRYKLLEKVGEGGFGAVYVAEQREPVKRRVALKIIKLGMDTRQVIARFEAERQALALMDHPNIAKVLDGGATETGRPYFVMELVRGMRITDYCDQNNLSTEERLNLFVQVCHAIQHAHQKGVIHRDIKASNILVTVVDGQAVPKVIDFGIAKATQGQLTDKTVYTQLHQFIGTPAYMSPEQAALSGVDVDTRSDIYSLGVLLYELLTGHTPFDPKTLLAAGLDEMRRMIRETEPPKPSTRLSTLDETERTTVAKHRQAEPATLSRLVRGDLDWIVMKCLEKDRGRRYETANNVARDIEHHLRHEPVSAAAPSTVYRAGKFVRRHKVGLAMAAGMVLLLAAGVVVSTWQAVRATRAESKEKAQRTRAEQLQATAEKVAKSETEQRARAEALAEANRQNLYAARIKLAEQASREGDGKRVLELLDSVRPGPGETDLRSFEWYYLSQVCRSERLTFAERGRLRQVAFSPDGQLLAVAGDASVIHLLDTWSGLERGQLRGHEGAVSALAFVPGGKALASASSDGSVRLWDVKSFKQLRLLFRGTNELSALAISSDGKRLAAGEGRLADGIGDVVTRYAPEGPAGRTLLIGLETARVEHILPGHKKGVRQLSFSPEGGRLASCGMQCSDVPLYDTATGHKLAVNTNFQGLGLVVGVAFTPDGQNLAVADWGMTEEHGQVRILDAATLKEVRAPVTRAGRILSLAISPDGTRLAGGGADGVTRLWDSASGAEALSLHGQRAEIACVAFAPDGKSIATAGWDKQAKVWDLETPSVQQRIPMAEPLSAAFSPDGRLLACAGPGVEVREAATGKLQRRLTNYVSPSIEITFSPDGSVLMATGKDGQAHFWDTRTWEHWAPAPADMETRTNYLASPASLDCHFSFSPDSRLLAMAGYDNVLRVWDVRTAALVDAIPGRSRNVYSVAFTPDGKSLITGEAGAVTVRDLATKQITGSITNQRSVFRVSQDGRTLAAARDPRTVVLNDLPALRQRAILAGHRDAVYCVAFSHDGRVVATASADGTVRLWQVSSGQELLTIKSDAGLVWSVAFSPDDRALAFGAGWGRTQRGGEITVLRTTFSPQMAAARKTDLRSREEFHKLVPPRPAGATARQIDLTACFNGLLAENLGSGIAGNNLASLPTGLQTLGGVSFDLRGIVMLTSANRLMVRDCPDEVTGIPVRQTCQALHFLHATSWSVPNQTVIGEYLVHYADHDQLKIPLLFGRNVDDFWIRPEFRAAQARIVWRGENAASQRSDRRVGLFDFRWRNPRPEVEITSVDFRSTITDAAPFLLAITADPDDWAEVEPEEIEQWDVQAEALASRGDEAGALAVYEGAVHEHPINSCSWVAMGRWLEQKNRLEEAARAFGRAADAAGADLDVFSSLLRLGEKLARRGKGTEAEAALRQALAFGRKFQAEGDPEFAGIQGDLTWLCYHLGRYAEAEPLYLDELRRNPKDASNLRHLESLWTMPSLVPVLVDSRVTPVTWHYTFSQPASNWFAPDFADAHWASGPAPFGTPLYLPRTGWTNRNIWLRREFELSEVPAGQLAFHVTHDDDVRLFLNGLEVPSEPGGSRGYALIPFSEAARMAIKTGRNVLAAHCQNNQQEGCIDVGIYLAPDLRIGARRLIQRLSEPLPPQFSSHQALWSQAEVLACLGGWREAAAAYSKLIELEPDNNEGYHSLACVLVQLGDLEAYRRHCARAVARFATTNDPATAERIAKDCLILPSSGVELATVAKMVDTALAAGPGHQFWAFFQFVKGLAEYRQGRFAAAIEWMEKVPKSDIMPCRTANTWLVVAMARHRLNQPAEARAALATGLQIVETKVPQPGVRLLTAGESWVEWSIAHALAREAKELIDGPSASKP